MVESELLQNQEKPVSLENAQEIDPVAALRWRWRICRISGKVFDITKEIDVEFKAIDLKLKTLGGHDIIK